MSLISTRPLPRVMFDHQPGPRAIMFRSGLMLQAKLESRWRSPALKWQQAANINILPPHSPVPTTALNP